MTVNGKKRDRFFSFVNVPFYRNLLITYTFIVLLSLLMAYFGWQSKAQLKLELQAEQRARAILTQMEIVERLLVDIETGQRGYIATSNGVFLDPLRAALAEYPAEIVELSRLVDYDLTQKNRVQQIKELASEKQQEALSVVQLERDGNHGDAVAKMNEGYGKRLMDSIRRLADDVKRQEGRDVTIRSEKTKIFSQFVDLSYIGGLLVIAITLVFSLNETVRVFEYNRQLQRELNAAYRKIRLEIGTELDSLNDVPVSEDLQKFSEKFRQILNTADHGRDSG